MNRSLVIGVMKALKACTDCSYVGAKLPVQMFITVVSGLTELRFGDTEALPATPVSTGNYIQSLLPLPPETAAPAMI